MCVKKRRCLMASNLAIDTKLLNEALEIGGLKTKKDTVNLALKEFVDRRRQLDIIKLFGKMDPDPDYDHKKGRNR
jgi:Arc/MetJ family transcription regulator